MTVQTFFFSVRTGQESKCERRRFYCLTKIRGINVKQKSNTDDKCFDLEFEKEGKKIKKTADIL